MIVRARIHPGIGIARVGDSAEEFTVGPEVFGAPSSSSSRDASGALKRQAARFRVYGIDESGQVVGEITSEDADITWTVHVANQKAAWYRFITALDISEAADLECPLRNGALKGRDRLGLIIDPGPKSIAGQSQAGRAEFRLDGGAFKDTPVSLGELRTDEHGRLLVLGGHGRSASPSGAPIYRDSDADTDPGSYNNADDWFDDTSDGPVTAEVVIGGKSIPVESAWVVVAPPNYAPDIVGWRTMTDLLVDLYVDNGWLPIPTPVRFFADVLPVLQRLSNLQWVNAGFAAMFGRGQPMDFDDPAFIARLAAPPVSRDEDPYGELRRQLFHAFRALSTPSSDQSLWPWIYGDAVAYPASPRSGLALPKLQAWILDQWVRGRFEKDQPQPPLTAIEDVSVAEQPDVLDRTALGYCLADAFHPGCELTWPMRHISLYSSPFRVRTRAATDIGPDLGLHLTQDNVLGIDGPLWGQSPGGLTRWMAMPWQGDTATCRSGYDAQYDPYLPTFWPARVPNQVLTEQDYRIATDQSRPRHERIAAYYSRQNWFRAFESTHQLSASEAMQRMVTAFASMGVVEARPGVSDDPDLPEVMYVENIPAHVTRTLRAAAATTSAEPDTPIPDPVRLAGWQSEEQLQTFRRARFRRR